jgi:CRISPR system Cascade subunit CasE
MLYLSRLVPDVRTTAARRDLANPYDMHRTLMRAFPDRDDGGPGRVLWRADPDPDSRAGGLHLLVQSTLPPDWSGLDPGWLATRPQERQFDPAFCSGQRLRFRLRANPTRRAGKSHLEPAFIGKRIPVIDTDGQFAWLARKADSGGFRLVGPGGSGDAAPPDVTTSHADTVRSRKRGPDGGKPVTIDHYAVLFDGRLEVTDADRLAQTLAQGIGPAKAFGCGLLSLAPAY